MDRRSFLTSLVAATAIGGVTTASGCIGSFALTDKVLSFNKGLGGIVVQEIVFLAFVIVPVYEISVFLDAVVFNIIEAFTGSNPLAATAAESRQVALADDAELYVIPDDDFVETEVVHRRRRLFRRFERRADGLAVRDERGDLLLTGRVTSSGGLEIVDVRTGELVAYHAPERVRAALEVYRTQGAEGLTANVLN